ncbi:MAG: D-glycero-beta-D-manno-heptose-7-phosphate kinase [Rhizomicrobium sp.]
MQSPAVKRIEGFANVRILIIGDVMLDRFIYGAVERISPEAPVPVLSVIREYAMPGGAANVARNVASLGGKAILMGVMGNDSNGRMLADLLAQNLSIDNQLLVVTERPTTTKTRLVAENQQIVRVDSEVRHGLGASAKALIARFAEQIAKADLVILSDYAKGVLTKEVLHEVIALARAAGKPIVADPKSDDISRYDGASVITPNFGEAAKATGVSGRDNAAAEAMAGAILAAAPALGAVVITRSADGMSLAERGKPVRHVPVAAKEVADVSGAGDTVVAALALALAAGADLTEAVDLSNAAAGIAVAKRGTAEVRA